MLKIFLCPPLKTFSDRLLAFIRSMRTFLPRIPAAGQSDFGHQTSLTKDILQTEIWEGRLDVKAEGTKK